MTDPTTTALLVTVPAAEAVVADLRAKLDHSAPWGVPAHVSALVPFVPPERLSDDVLARVGACAAAIPAFSCTFASVRWFGEDVVWLAPEQVDPFRALTDLLVREFPDPVPHLTVASTLAADRAELPGAAATVEARLPVTAWIDRLHLFAGVDAPGGWHPVADFPLAQPS